MSRELLLSAGVVVTDPDLLPGGGTLTDGAVLVREGRVAEVGPRAALTSRHTGVQELGSPSHVLIPGLVNAHDHGIGVSPWRLGLRDETLEPWLIGLWGLPPVDEYLSALWCDLQNLRAGVTTIVHAVPPGPQPFDERLDALTRAHRDAGIRALCALPVADQQRFVYAPDEEFLATLPRRLRDAVLELGGPPPAAPQALAEQAARAIEPHRGQERLSFALHPTGPQWCSDELLVALRRTAERLGAGLHLHCLESRLQRDDAARRHGTSTLAHLEDLGVLGPDVSLAHCTWITPDELAICASTGTSIVHNASSNLRLRVGVMPVREALDAGVTVGIGLDNCTLADDEDMLAEMRLVSALHGAPRDDRPPAPLGAEDVLRMATTGGACAALLDGEVGRLLPGYRADAVLLDLDAMRMPYTHPATPIADVLVRRAGRDHVSAVVVGGEPVLRDGRLVAHDEQAVSARLAVAAGRKPGAEDRRRAAVVEELAAVVRARTTPQAPERTGP
jgi:5-methylthioadenosine/S-adenosylhomocysteine deaminase